MAQNPYVDQVSSQLSTGEGRRKIWQSGELPEVVGGENEALTIYRSRVVKEVEILEESPLPIVDEAAKRAMSEVPVDRYASNHTRGIFRGEEL